MRRGSARIAATAALAGMLCLLTVAGASAQQFGSNLQAASNAGICPVPNGASEASCTFAQLLLADDHVAAGGVQPPGSGNVITGFRVAGGAPAPGTSSVKLRLRLMDPVNGFAFTAGLPYLDMPLTPGIHEFPTRLEIPERTLIGLDILVSGVPGEAAAPLAHTASGVGSLYSWAPSPPEAGAPPPTSEENLELLLGLVVEPDRDLDGYGDKTQDRCPEDSRRQANCDRRPPRTKLTYAPRQDFLGKGKVVVYMRTNETAEVIADGQIEIPGKRTSIWGIHSDDRRLGRGDKRKLVLRVPPKARQAVARAIADGRRVLVKVSAYGVDRFGNESGTTVATIRPKR